MNNTATYNLSDEIFINNYLRLANFNRFKICNKCGKWLIQRHDKTIY